MNKKGFSSEAQAPEPCAINYPRITDPGLSARQASARPQHRGMRRSQASEKWDWVCATTWTSLGLGFSGLPHCERSCKDLEEMNCRCPDARGHLTQGSNRPRSLSRAYSLPGQCLLCPGQSQRCSGHIPAPRCRCPSDYTLLVWGLCPRHPHLLSSAWDFLVGLLSTC